LAVGQSTAFFRLFAKALGSCNGIPKAIAVAGGIVPESVSDVGQPAVSGNGSSGLPRQNFLAFAAQLPPYSIGGFSDPGLFD
jgi:hypothetical protein